MTLVSYAHDFIYLRTRKTASTSTELYLQPFCTPAGRKVEEYNRRQILSDVGIVGRRLAGVEPSFLMRTELRVRRKLGLKVFSPHMPAEQVRAALAPEFWDRALKISSVRNPFKRVVSSYYWWLTQSGKEIPDNKKKLIRNFRRAVRSGRFHDDQEIVMIGKSFVPDLLIRQEHLVEDIEALAERLNLDTSRTALPLTKKTSSSDADKRPSLRELYDEETADIVRKRFNWAFAHADYSREVPE